MKIKSRYFFLMSIIFLFASLSTPYLLDLYFHYYPIKGESDWNPIEVNVYFYVKPSLTILFVVCFLSSVYLRMKEKKKIGSTEPKNEANSETHFARSE